MEYRDPLEKNKERVIERDDEMAASASKRPAEPTPEQERNADPLTGEPGSHPVGTGAGAAAGGIAGAAIGAAGGPVGSIVGAAIGGVVGGVAGKMAGEAINPTEEDAYWRENYPKRDYAEPGRGYDDYQPAYRYGWESKPRYPDRTFDQAEEELRRDWDKSRGSSSLDWEHARKASQDAWKRIEEKTGFGVDPMRRPDQR